MNEQYFTDEQESVFEAMRRKIALTPLPDAQPASFRERIANHRRLLAGGAGALAMVAAVAAAVFATGAFTSAPPAFAVTTTRESVTITLNELGALNSLNAKLAAENIPIRAVSVVPGCTATAQEVGANGRVGVPQTLEAGSASGPVGSMTIVLGRRPAPGDTLVVGISRSGRWVMFPQKIEGAVPRCASDSATSLKSDCNTCSADIRREAARLGQFSPSPRMFSGTRRGRLLFSSREKTKRLGSTSTPKPLRPRP